MNRMITDESGQGLTEYAMIIGLISVILIAMILNTSFQCAIKKTYIQITYSFHLSDRFIDDSEVNFYQFLIESGLDPSFYDYNNGNVDCNNAPTPIPAEPDPIPWL